MCVGIELKHLCLEYMTPWLLNLVRFCKHNDDAKRQRVTAILDKLITMTINEKQMYPSIQAKIWGSLGQVGISLLGSQCGCWPMYQPTSILDVIEAVQYSSISPVCCY